MISLFGIKSAKRNSFYRGVGRGLASVNAEHCLVLVLGNYKLGKEIALKGRVESVKISREYQILVALVFLDLLVDLRSFLVGENGGIKPVAPRWAISARVLKLVIRPVC